MKKIKMLKKWGIYQLSAKEIAEYGFEFAIITPDTMECPHPYLNPSDSDSEHMTLEAAEYEINHYVPYVAPKPARKAKSMSQFLGSKLLPKVGK